MKLSDKAIMVSVISSMPQMTKTDKDATHAAEDAMNARSGVGRYTKELYPKSLVQPIRTVITSLQNDIKTIGMIYSRNKIIVPTSLSQKALDYERRRVQELAPLKTAFKINWQQVLHAAQQEQGDMFDASVYPDVSDIDKEISLRLEFGVAPDVGMFGLMELSETIKQRAEVDVTNALQSNVLRFVSELAGVVESMATKLRGRLELDIAGEKSRNAPRFHDSLMENLEHLVDVIPQVNFTNDIRLVTLAQDCRAKLRVPLDVLKSGSIETRQRILQDADDILAAMKGML